MKFSNVPGWLWIVLGFSFLVFCFFCSWLAIVLKEAHDVDDDYSEINDYGA